MNTNKNRVYIGQNLKRLCAERGVSLRQVEAQLDIPKNYIYGYAENKVRATVNIASKLAVFFTVRLEDMIDKNRGHRSSKKYRTKSAFIGDQLKAAMEAKKVSVIDVWKSGVISRAAVYDILNNKNRARKETIEKLAEFLETDAQQLIGKAAARKEPDQKNVTTQTLINQLINEIDHEDMVFVFRMVETLVFKKKMAQLKSML